MSDADIRTLKVNGVDLTDPEKVEQLVAAYQIRMFGKLIMDIIDVETELTPAQQEAMSSFTIATMSYLCTITNMQYGYEIAQRVRLVQAAKGEEVEINDLIEKCVNMIAGETYNLDIEVKEWSTFLVLNAFLLGLACGSDNPIITVGDASQKWKDIVKVTEEVLAATVDEKLLEDTDQNGNLRLIM